MFCKLKTFSLIIHNLTCKHRKQKDTTTQRWYRINYSLIRPGFKQQLTLKRKNANGLRLSKNERSAIENHLSAPSRMHTWKWTVGKRGETHNIVCLMYFRKQVVHCFQIAQMQLLSLFPFMCVIWINWNWMKMGKLCFFAPFFPPAHNCRAFLKGLTKCTRLQLKPKRGATGEAFFKFNKALKLQNELKADRAHSKSGIILIAWKSGWALQTVRRLI